MERTASPLADPTTAHVREVLRAIIMAPPIRLTHTGRTKMRDAIIVHRVTHDTVYSSSIKFYDENRKKLKNRRI